MVREVILAYPPKKSTFYLKDHAMANQMTLTPVKRELIISTLTALGLWDTDNKKIIDVATLKLTTVCTCAPRYTCFSPR